MRFRVRKPFAWEGKDYQVGQVIEIPEGHPRLRALIEQGRFVTYDSSELVGSARFVAAKPEE